MKRPDIPSAYLKEIIVSFQQKNKTWIHNSIARPLLFCSLLVIGGLIFSNLVFIQPLTQNTNSDFAFAETAGDKSGFTSSEFMFAEFRTNEPDKTKFDFPISIFNPDVSSSGQVDARGLAKGQEDLEKQVRSTLKENGETIRFLENKGQLANDEVLYYFEGYKGAVYIEKSRIRFVANDDTLLTKPLTNDSPFAGLNSEKVQAIKGTHTFSVYLDGAKSNPHINLGESFGTRYNYFLGEDPKGWVSGVKAAKDLTLEDVYPGINLRLYSTADGTMEFDWVMDAGADYNKVKLRFEGQDNLDVDHDGSLKVGLRFTDLKFHIPESYQVTDKGKVQVSFAFNKSNENTISFATQAKIDKRFPLIIDPTLNWGTFMDGNQISFDQYLFAIQVDPVDGMVYCAGGSNINIPTGSAPYDADGYSNTYTGSATSRIAVVYRINSTGTDLVDLTLYGPSSGASNDVVAYALSLSSTKVYIGGVTNADLPLTGSLASSFDNTRSTGDGFVAVFTRDLGTLDYATYLGSAGDETRGVTSIRAFSDNSFVIGLTAVAALPANYISVGPADGTFGGNSEIYIAKFTTFNTLSWGTYVGGTNDETSNDIEVFGDGRVAFTGYGNGTITETNSAAANSTATDNTDGIIGVLNSSGTAFNYLDKIGGANNDRINDVELVGETLYWTGSASTGFPVTGGAYNTTNSGGLDVVVGAVSAAGTTGYIATYYGTTTDDIGNGIKLITFTDCGGGTTNAILIFGTVGGSGLPVQNVNSDPFYYAGYNGGLDMFFAEFPTNLAALTFATYMGGNNNDYLGDTGDPRGSNHLWVINSVVYLGTTTHSATHLPPLAVGGFDTSTDDTNDDKHIVISVQFGSTIISDYGDAPASYGAPSHIVNCSTSRMGLLVDTEAASAASTLADGDDLAGTDDEDGISTLPAFSDGGPQDISVTVNNILNSTGLTANLYGWIDFNGDGQFSSGELASTTVANSFSGSKILTWTGVSVSGNATNHYLRIRMTTNNLVDVGGTPAVDERSTVPATDGEVEDYRAIDLTCPTSTSVAACQTQAAINTAYSNWLGTAFAGGGCNNGTLSNNSSGAPSSCGGAKTVTFTYTSACAPLTTTCMSTFTVTADTPPLISTPPVAWNIEGCSTASITNPAFASISTASSLGVFQGAPNSGVASDNCGITAVTYIDVANGSCPIVVTRTWTVTDVCGNNTTCNQTINVNDTSAPGVTGSITTTNVQGCVAGDAPAAVTTVLALESLTGNLQIADACTPDLNLVVSSSQTASGTCPLVITRTYRVTDACNNTSVAILHTINVNDTTAPSVTGSISLTNVQGCVAGDAPAAVTTVLALESLTGNLQIDDGCTPDLNLIVSSSQTASGTCPIVITRTYHVTDACNNTSVAILHTINVNDTSAPLVTGSISLTNVQGCVVGDAPAAVTTVSALEALAGNLQIADACISDANLVVSSSQTSSGSCPIVITRTYHVTDLCNNTSVPIIQTINVNDNTAPSMTSPVNVTLNCQDNTSSLNTGVATATDNCSAVTITQTETSTQDPATDVCEHYNYLISRTWVASDACGNSSTSIQTIQVQDVTPPDITCRPDSIIYCPNPVSFGNASATDACDPLVLIFFFDDIVPGSCPQEKSVTRIWTAVDICGNEATCSRTILVRDTTPPVMTLPANVTLNCQDNITSANTGVATATDVCSVVISITESETSTQDPATDVCEHYNYAISRTWVASDACGNSSTGVQTIQVQDITPPDIICRPDSIIYCPNPASFGNASATDACDPSVPIFFFDDIVSGSCPQEKSVTRIWTAVDVCGNEATCSRTIVVRDTVPPTITSCPANVTVNCQDDNTSANTGIATATDVCSVTVAITQSQTSTQVPDINACAHYTYLITRTWTASDGCNSSSCIQTIQVRDVTPPAMTCPANVTVNCQDDNTSASTGIATATDACSGVTITQSQSSTQDPDANLCGHYTYVINRTWIATDKCNNSNSCVQTIQVHDVTPPAITCPADVTVAYAESTMPANTGLATATDNCDLNSSVTYGDSILSENQITRTWSASDLCGNSSSCQQNIYINNNCLIQLPLIPPDTICANGSVDFLSPDLGIGLTYFWDFGSGSTPSTGVGLGPHTVSYVTTTNNQMSGAIVTMTISKPGCTDLIGQVSTVEINPYPNAAILGSTSSMCYYTNRTFQPVADSIPGATYQWTFGNSAVPLTAMGYGPHTVYYTTAGLITVKLVIHPNEPGAQCPDSSTISFTVTACPGNITGSVKSVSGAGIGSVTVNLYADANLNGLPDNAIVVKSANTASNGNYNLLSIIPGNYVIVQTQPLGWLSHDDADISPDGDLVSNIDSLDNIIPCTLTPSKLDGGNNFIERPAPGTITGYVFNDLDLNSIPGSTEGISGVTLNIYHDDNADGQPDNGTPVATQVTNSLGFFSFTQVSVGNYVLIETQPVGFGSIKDIDATNDLDVVPNTNIHDDIIPVTIVNAENDNENYFIENFGPPVITCPPNVTINCQDDNSSANTGVATATDLCPGLIITESQTSTQNPNTNLCGHYTYQINRTWRATDNCGNSSTCIQLIQVHDVTAPSITTCPVNVTINCQDDNSSSNTGVATATDNCSGVDISQSQISTQDPNVNLCAHYSYLITRTWRASDACGNSSSCLQTIQVHDITAPVITCPTNVTVNCQDDNTSSNTGVATGTDNCSGVIISQSQTNTQNPDINTCGHYTYVISRTWNAADACGNSSSCLQTIQVRDITAPVITCPVNVTVNFQEDNSSASTGQATATDNCSGVDISQSQTSTQDPDVGHCAHYTYVITRTWMTTDVCSNSSSCIQSIQVRDDIVPVITCPANVTLNCEDDNTSVNTGNATATDNCSVVSISESQISTQDMDPEMCEHYSYEIMRTWFATDGSGNSSSCTQTIEVNDTTPPDWITSSGNLDRVLQCSDAAGIVSAQELSPLAGDTCESPVTYYKISGSFETDPGCSHAGTFTNTWTATDVCGNTSLALFTQVITITDDIPPSFTTAPGDLNRSYECDETLNIAAAQSLAPEAEDNCGGTVTYNKTNGSFVADPDCTHSGTYTNTWTATDECGNTSTAIYTQVITITDNTPPSFTTVAGALNRSYECDETANIAAAQALAPEAEDNCGGTVTYNKTSGSFVSDPECLHSGTYTNTWTTTDECGNTSTSIYTQVITITDDTPPSFTTPEGSLDRTYECDEAVNIAAAQALEPEAIDNCGGTVTYDETAGSFVADPDCPYSGTYTNSWTATDICGNTSAAFIQIITIHDGTPPEITCPSDITINFGESTLPVNTESATALDNCDMAPMISYVDSIPSDTVIIRKWNATDACGNASTCHQTIQIKCILIVTNILDSGPGSLRDVIECAKAGDTIKFDNSLAGLTINITTDRIDIEKNVTLFCTLSSRVIIASQIPGLFEIENNVTVEFRQLEMISGSTLDGNAGSAIENSGSVILHDVNIFKNIILPPGQYLIRNTPNSSLTFSGTCHIEMD